jgi:hypothetical protein
MSELDNAMQEHMAFIVLSEGRPFSFRDFFQFTIDGKIYKITPGTFRNKILALKKAGVVELDYNSGTAFYTLKGHRFGKQVTPNHTVVQHNDPVYNMLQNLTLDKQSVHDIRLRFSVTGIWTLLSNNQDFNRNERSQDIAIPSWVRDNVIVRVFVHKTDTVSVILGCSLHPIPLDFNGIIRFFNLLVRIEERSQNILGNYAPINSNKKYNLIPDYRKWIVTMWHFGRDASIEYAGERFSITVENLEHVLNRLYVKNLDGKKKIRFERQEYPNKTVLDAMEEKLGNITNV